MVKKYKVSEVFLSPQGEGNRTGRLYVFIRLSECNLRCTVEREGFDCDTDFVSSEQLTADGVLQRVREVSEPHHIEWACLTGGEPTLQLEEDGDELIAALAGDGYCIAIETNGTNRIPKGLDYVAVSPKTAWHTLKAQRADEVRLVRRHGQAIPEAGVVLKQFPAAHLFVSPAFDPDGSVGPANFEWCLALLREQPIYRLSMQLHKLMGLP